MAVQVEPGHPERGHLAEPDAGVGKEKYDEPIHLIGAGVIAAVLARIGRVATRVCEVIDLVVGQVEVLMLRHARQIYAGRDIARQPAVLERHVQDQAQYPMDLLHRGG